MKDTDEFNLKETFKSLGNQYFDTSGIIIGPGDDAGLVENNKDTIYSVDASVAGIHFPEDLSPELNSIQISLYCSKRYCSLWRYFKMDLSISYCKNSDLSWMRSFA